MDHFRLNSVADAVTELQSFAQQGNALAALRCIDRIALLIPDIAADLVEMGLSDGLTKKALAEALGVPPRTLRGATAKAAV